MNGGRSDASTSTDDVKSRPLCLFYFTHPFGVLSAEPPTLAAAPPHVARAFLNMQPVPPWTLWSHASVPSAPHPGPAAPPPAAPSDDDYNSASSSRPSYELGAATVHRTPLSLVSVTRTRKCTLDFGTSRDSISSPLFSSDMWFNSSSSGRSNEYPRRLVPYNKILPPLQLPSPKDSSNLSSCDDFWPKKCLNPEKFSLPPIELPSVKVNIVRSKKCSASSEEASGAEGGLRSVRVRRRLGVSKPRRARAADLRRLLATLMRRALAGGRRRRGERRAAVPLGHRRGRTTHARRLEPPGLNCDERLSRTVTRTRHRLSRLTRVSAKSLLGDEHDSTRNLTDQTFEVNKALTAPSSVRAGRRLDCCHQTVQHQQCGAQVAQGRADLYRPGAARRIIVDHVKAAQSATCRQHCETHSTLYEKRGPSRARYSAAGRYALATQPLVSTTNYAHYTQHKREVWAEPRSLLSRCRTLHRPRAPPAARAPPAPALMERAAAELAPRPGASPGLLRRRYSVPETIMRKYRLAQQRSDSEESAPPTNRSVASASPPREASGSPVDTPHRFARRDRELMRKSALMRRMWGRPCEPGRACCCCGAEPCDPAPYGGRETRSLDGSRSELRPLSSLASSRSSHAAAGWATPKRQRLDCSRDFRGSDEMLRAAMKNSYDRAEESRTDRATRAEFSDSTYRSHGHEPSSSYLETVTDAFTDSDGSKFGKTSEGNAFTQCSERQSSDTTTLEVKSITADDTNVTSEHSAPFALSDERSLSESSDSCSASYPTTKESAQLTRSAHIAGRVCARSASLLRDDNDAVPYDKPLSIHTPSYELLEIVVSETLNVSAVPAIGAHALPPDKLMHNLRAPTVSQKCAQNINIDEYVSNILVESLNSLTDQLECMNASMGNDRKISIVEKEIKVKLQNTGVNTIVHLSPTSNNQIIFGNEELCINEERKDCCNNPQDVQDAHDALAIRDEAHSVESNNNLTSAGSPGACPCKSFDLQHDNVNQAVLQQIQKLFQDELHNLDPDTDYSGKTIPEISHIEISNVTDVFIDNESEPRPIGADNLLVRGAEYEVISGVGAGSYYPAVDEQPVVPRFSAFPHTDSMEVNTSSSDDADLVGSDCTSLVDSLDDPNSPRSVLPRRGFTGRRNELVRSAIDVLDLLPENARNEEMMTPKDKGEAFFIKIKDNECDCDKENVNVADRMPEKIKQRLYRRHRKREMRMECARRTRGKQRLRDRDAERRHDEHCRSRRDVERECVAIVNALIDDVINKIAQDEYKCMRIKHRPSRMVTSKSDDHVAKRTWKKELGQIDDRDPFKCLKNNTTQYDSYNSRKHRGERHQIHGKLSFVTRPAVASDDPAAKRIYQKSEIHEGNKCIEILEILEYVNGSQSSPETTTSDENQNNCMKNKKSRIPIPIYEKNQKSSHNEPNKNNSRRSSVRVERNGNTNRLIADMLLGALGERTSPPPAPPAPRRASVPHAEPRSRSNSLRFKQTFDIIPEERSSLSLDSGTEDLNHNRRASAPDVAEQYRESPDAECNDAPTPLAGCSPPHKLKPHPDSPRRCKHMKSAATSPITDSDGDKRALKSKNQTTMTSPSSKSAATSPMRATTTTESVARGEAGLAGKRGPGGRGRAWLGFTRPDTRASHDEGHKERAESDKGRPRRSVITQHERTQDTRAQTERGARPERTERSERSERAERPPRPAPRHPLRVRSPSAERAPATHSDLPSDRSPDDISHIIGDKRKPQSFSFERSDDDGMHAPSVKLPEFRGGGDSGGATSSDSSESGGSLLCSLAPKWLSQGRARRAARRRDQERTAPHAAPSADPAAPDLQPPGGWSVTVAGSCRAALPADVEMRLRFPQDAHAATDAHEAHAAATGPCQECTCRHCATCACSARMSRGVGRSAPPLPPAAPPSFARLARTDSSQLTLTMKKEALDSSILASKSSKKLGEPLPDVETYRASRSKLKSSVKTRRGYSLHCWLPDAEATPIRGSNGLSVLGSAIIPELKPRVPTMSERDLTRVYTPRHYLRS